MRTNTDTDAIILRVPSRLEVRMARSADPYTITGVRWDLEVHGYVIDVETGEPTRIRSCGVHAERPSKQEMLDLLKVWFDHEMREQLGMEPHKRAAAEPASSLPAPSTVQGSANSGANSAAEPEDCDHTWTQAKADGSAVCLNSKCGKQTRPPDAAAEPEAKCMGMIPGTAFMCGEMAGYYCPNCRREDDR